MIRHASTVLWNGSGSPQTRQHALETFSPNQSLRGFYKAKLGFVQDLSWDVLKAPTNSPLQKAITAVLTEVRKANIALKRYEVVVEGLQLSDPSEAELSEKSLKAAMDQYHNAQLSHQPFIDALSKYLGEAWPEDPAESFAPPRKPPTTYDTKAAAAWQSFDSQKASGSRKRSGTGLEQSSSKRQKTDASTSQRALQGGSTSQITPDASMMETVDLFSDGPLTEDEDSASS